MNQSTTIPETSQNTNILRFLLIYLVIWSVSHMISDANLDPAGNMLENYGWGQEFTWGTSKHPPLMAWITAAWFSIFPTSDSFYHVLAYAVSACGLLGTWFLIHALRLGGLAVPAILLLSMALPYSTLAVKFNANTVLLAVWPWVAFSWANAVNKNTPGSAVLLGLLAAVSVLGKYYSGIFLLTLFMASLVTPAGRNWLFSRYMIIAAFTGLIAVAPHLAWLIDNHFPTLGYVDGKGDGETNLERLLRFGLTPFVYWLIPWLIAAWLYSDGANWKARLKEWPRMIMLAWRPPLQRMDVLILAVAPWAITLLIGASGFVVLRSHWAIPIGFTFSMVWLLNLSAISKRDPARVQRGAYIAATVWLVMALVLAPPYTWQQATSGQENFYQPRTLAAETLYQQWQERYPRQPLKWAGGDWPENATLPFYVDNSIRAAHGFPGEFPAVLIPHEGWQDQAGVLLCPLGRVKRPRPTDCPEHAERWLAQKGQHPEPFRFEVFRTGLKFPLEVPFGYIAYPYLPQT
ncbi:MAG: glycosyltransferase family 39 protein [Pseudomonadales bacterium]|nr:glycosyltransferase family 39 protein [Pseudomonadales bacterium]